MLSGTVRRKKSETVAGDIRPVLRFVAVGVGDMTGQHPFSRRALESWINASTRGTL